MHEVYHESYRPKSPRTIIINSRRIVSKRNRCLRSAEASHRRHVVKSRRALNDIEISAKLMRHFTRPSHCIHDSTRASAKMPEPAKCQSITAKYSIKPKYGLLPIHWRGDIAPGITAK